MTNTLTPVEYNSWVSSLSTEIVWLPDKLYPKKPAGMHWLGYNDAVSSLNEAKT